jgi:hypothetical protein
MTAWFARVTKLNEKEDAPSHAPLMEAHGATNLGTVWDVLLPRGGNFITDGLPSFVGMLKPWLFGYSATMIQRTMTPDSLGAVYIYYKGSHHLLMVSMVDLEKAWMLGRDAKDKDKLVDCPQLVSLMQSMKENDAKAWKDAGITVYQARVTVTEPPDATPKPIVVIVPPGFVMVSTGIRDESGPCGIRRSFLTMSDACRKNMDLIHRLTTATDQPKIQNYIDLIAVAVEKKRGNR